MWNIIIQSFLTIITLLSFWYTYRLHLYVDSLEERLRIKDNEVNAINNFLKAIKKYINSLKNEIKTDIKNEAQSLRREMKKQSNKDNSKDTLHGNILNRKIDQITKKEKKDEHRTQPNDG